MVMIFQQVDFFRVWMLRYYKFFAISLGKLMVQMGDFQTYSTILSVILRFREQSVVVRLPLWFLIVILELLILEEFIVTVIRLVEW